MLSFLFQVDQYDDVDEEITPVSKSEQIVISKLNPEVPEFIPKGASTSPRHKNKVISDNKSINNNNNISTKDDCHAGKTNILNHKEASKESVRPNFKKQITSVKKTFDMNEKRTCNNDVSLNRKINGTITNDGLIKDAHVTKHEKDVNVITGHEENSTTIEHQGSNNVCGDVRMDKRIDISQLNSDQIKEITMKLKSKISNNSNDDLRLGREKNVAIATLLKLYSATPPQVKSPKPDEGVKDNKPIKLFTPEYFESCRPKSLDRDDFFPYCNGSCNATTTMNIENSTDSSPHTSKLSKNDNEASEISKDDSETKIPAGVINDTKITKSLKTLKRKEDSLETSKIPNFSTESLKPVEPKATISTSSNHLVSEKPATPKFEVEVSKNNEYAADPEMQKSIKKVNNWFEKPASPKPKPMAICLGPIAFKRKAAPIAKSPVSDGTSNRSTPTGIPQIAQYKPSKYAEDLGKKFEKQGSQQEVNKKQNQDIWTRAQSLMKEKEEKMKRKLLEQSRRSQEELEEAGSDYS